MFIIHSNVGADVTADHKVVNEENAFAASLRSRGTGSPLGFKGTLCRKSCAGNEEKLQKFVPPNQKPGINRTENSLEFIRACEGF